MRMDRISTNTRYTSNEQLHQNTAGQKTGTMGRSCTFHTDIYRAQYLKQLSSKLYSPCFHFNQLNMWVSQRHPSSYSFTSNNTRLCLASLRLLWHQFQIAPFLIIQYYTLITNRFIAWFCDLTRFPTFSCVPVRHRPRIPAMPKSWTHPWFCTWTVPTRWLFSHELCSCNHSLPRWPVLFM